MANRFSFSNDSSRVILFAAAESRPMTIYGSKDPRLDSDGRQLHAVRGVTLLVDGGQLSEATIEAPEAMSFPAGAVIAPAGGPAVVTVTARPQSEDFASLGASARAPRWEVIGQADLASLLAGAASSPEKAAAHGKGGDQR